MLEADFLEMISNILSLLLIWLISFGNDMDKNAHERQFFARRSSGIVSLINCLLRVLCSWKKKIVTSAWVMDFFQGFLGSKSWLDILVSFSFLIRFLKVRWQFLTRTWPFQLLVIYSQHRIFYSLIMNEDIQYHLENHLEPLLSTVNWNFLRSVISMTFWQSILLGIFIILPNHSVRTLS